VLGLSLKGCVAFCCMTCDEYALKPVWFLDLTQNKKEKEKIMFVWT
jgi:hypothetical protein